MARRDQPRERTQGPGWQHVTGALVQCARVDDQHAVGRALFTFDPDCADDVVFLYRLRNKVARAVRGGVTGPDAETVAAIVKEDYEQGQWRRWELPPGFTDGVQVFLEELRLPFDRVPLGTEFISREEVLLPCRANPDGGGIEMQYYLRDAMERRHNEFVQCLSHRGVRVVAALVQANNALFHPGRETLPCLVLITFDEMDDAGPYLLNLAKRVFNLKETQPDDPDERFVADLVTDERAVFWRRVKLPENFTGGPTVYAADLWVYRPYLPEGRLTSRQLLCIAEPGPEGGLELLPQPKDMAAALAAGPGPQPRRTATKRRRPPVTEVEPVEEFGDPGTFQTPAGRRVAFALGLALVLFALIGLPLIAWAILR